MTTTSDTTSDGEPQDAEALEPARGAFSIRLPPGLYRELREKASNDSVSMNALITEAVAQFLNRPDLAPSAGPPKIDSRIAAEAVGRSDRTVGALKGIGKHLLNLDQVALAAVVYAAAARVVADQDQASASRELAFTADQVQRHNHLELAASVFDESLRLDPNNLEAVNRLGQLLHHLAERGNDMDRYRRAEELLSRVTFIDNRAKLFHGWSQLHLARKNADQYGERAALREIDEAMRSWAFGQHDAGERQSWLRQLRRLKDLDPNYDTVVRDLVLFAGAHGWRTHPVTDADLGRELTDKAAGLGTAAPGATD
jgi:tetratricopeptide (TPR) repeat protein